VSLRGADDIAERRIADSQYRERFLGLVREAMATSIRNGDPLRHSGSYALRRSEPIEAVDR
jgi:hypothetical protein